jgi:hypothetical protein
MVRIVAIQEKNHLITDDVVSPTRKEENVPAFAPLGTVAEALLDLLPLVEREKLPSLGPEPCEIRDRSINEALQLIDNRSPNGIVEPRVAFREDCLGSTLGARRKSPQLRPIRLKRLFARGVNRAVNGPTLAIILLNPCCYRRRCRSR